MKVHRLEVGRYLIANCYIAENNGECVIFDACSESEKIRSFIENKGLKPVAIVQTHAHFDHIGALDVYDLPVYIHSEELDILHNPNYNYAADVNMKVCNTKSLNLQHIADGDILELAGMKIEVIHTPGHTKGSVCFLIDDTALISGDTVFWGDIGRTDLYSGSPAQMKASLKKLFTKLAPEVVIYPGHDASTTAAAERVRYI